MIKAAALPHLVPLSTQVSTRPGPPTPQDSSHQAHFLPPTSPHLCSTQPARPCKRTTRDPPARTRHAPEPVAGALIPSPVIPVALAVPRAAAPPVLVVVVIVPAVPVPVVLPPLPPRMPPVSSACAAVLRPA